MDPRQEYQLLQTRRQFFSRSAKGIGAAALASLLNPNLFAEEAAPGPDGILKQFHHKPTAKRVIYLFMSGAPSQLDMYDYKPKMGEMFDVDLPDSIRMGQRITTMTSGQARFPIAPSIFKFQQYGQAGAWVSELLPETAKIVDDLAIVKTVYTEAINHDPAITYIQTGSQLPGRPSMGAWLSYGLGSANAGPADLRGVCIPRGAPSATPRPSTRGCGAAAGCRRGTRAWPCVPAATRSCTSPIPTGVRRERRRRDARRRGRAESEAIRRLWRPGNRPPESPSTRWPTECRRRCPI